MKISLVLRVAADFFLAANQSEKNKLKKQRSIYSAIVTAYGVLYRMDGYDVVRSEGFKRIMIGLRNMGMPYNEGVQNDFMGMRPLTLNEATQSELYMFMKLAQQLAEEQDV